MSATLGQPTVIIEPRKGLFRLDLRAVWQFRELLYFLIWRDVKIRYRQTAIGAAWAILQPLLTMAIFAAIFGNVLRVPSEGLPYPVFAYTALVLWQYVAQAVAESGRSLVGDASLITRVYFPRLVIPLAAVLRPLVDFVLSFLVLVAMLAWFGIRPTWAALTVPLLLAFAVLTVLGASLWLSALNVRYRDVGHALPFLIQIWMFVSPVAYPAGLVPERWRFVYGLNPITGVVEGFRWALLGADGPDLGAMAVSAAGVLVVLAGGVIHFKQMERTFPDVV